MLSRILRFLNTKPAKGKLKLQIKIDIYQPIEEEYSILLKNDKLSITENYDENCAQAR